MTTYISISKMAKLCGITRQTLIHYDNIDLFKPVKVDANGYRCYCKHQIPYLREICFLKSLGISLKDIQQHFQERTPENEIYLLEKQKQYIMNQIAKLNTLREYLNQRIDLYKEAVDARMMWISLPFVRYIDARQAIFKEWLQPIDKDNLHMTLMDLWQRIFEWGMVYPGGFGSIIKKEAAQSGDWLAGTGSCIFLPIWNKEHENTLMIPAGEYVCMYKYGMPYDTEHLEKLMQWLVQNGYELIGDIVDVCLLDTTFYKKEISVDFCMLQAPVALKNK
ncbi:MAG: MerR family transcriptional regulator [Acidaminococcaceae bacterium]|nr:MerR family transcriptional regulator [Acidaminococcaceae bacterium]